MGNTGNSLANMKLVDLFKTLDERYGAGNYRIRKISRLREGEKYPSLTLRTELEKLSLKIGDLVLVTVQGKKIIIEPLV